MYRAYRRRRTIQWSRIMTRTRFESKSIKVHRLLHTMMQQLERDIPTLGDYQSCTHSPPSRIRQQAISCAMKTPHAKQHLRFPTRVGLLRRLYPPWLRQRHLCEGRDQGRDPCLYLALEKKAWKEKMDRKANRSTEGFICLLNSS